MVKASFQWDMKSPAALGKARAKIHSQTDPERGKGCLCFSESSEGEGGWYYYVIDSLAVFPEGLNDPGSDENVPA